MKRFFLRQLKKVNALLGQPGAARERILGYGRRVVTVVKRAPRALTLEFYALAARRKQPGILLHGRYRSALAAVIQEGIDRGEFRPLDAQQAAAGIMGLCQGLILLWAVQPDVFPLERFLEPSLQTMLDGMKAESKPA